MLALNVSDDELRRRAAQVRLVSFDVDGVMTDGGLYYNDLGHEAKRFHVHDGLGIKMLERAGFLVAIVTARDTPAVAKRAADLGVTELHQGRHDKRAVIEAIAARHGLSLEAVAHVGDDLPDLAAMRAVGLAITVPNATESIRAMAHGMTFAAGGQGAVREVCDWLLRQHGRYDAALAGFLR